MMRIIIFRGIVSARVRCAPPTCCCLLLLSGSPRLSASLALVLHRHLNNRHYTNQKLVRI